MQTVSVLIGCLCLIIALFRVIEQLLQVFQVLQEMFLLCIYLLLRIVLLLDEISPLSVRTYRHGQTEKQLVVVFNQQTSRKYMILSAVP